MHGMSLTLENGFVTTIRAAAIVIPAAALMVVFTLFVSAGRLQAQSLQIQCRPTAPDSLGPFYKPGAPQREKVGSGYRLEGVVRSARTCLPIPGARIELWMTGPDGQYHDAYRATVYAKTDGAYRFESHYPKGYYGRPPHIHIRVSASHFKTLTTQHYPSDAENRAIFDLVLLPQP